MITYSVAISACVKPERVLELLAVIQGMALEPTVITFSATISACEKGQ